MLKGETGNDRRILGVAVGLRIGLMIGEKNFTNSAVFKSAVRAGVAEAMTVEVKRFATASRTRLSRSS